MHKLFNAVEDIFPLTPMQEGMFNQCLQSDNPAMYTEQAVVKICGDYQPELNRAAWLAVMEAHPALRTRIFAEQMSRPHQVVLNQQMLPWQFVDWSARDGDLELAVKEFAAQDKRSGFDLHNQCLFRVQLIQAAPDTFYMILTIHHLIVDGWSFAVLFDDLSKAYQQALNKEQIRLPAGPSMARHCAEVESGDHQVSEAYWQTKLQDFETGGSFDSEFHYQGQGESEVEFNVSVAQSKAIRAGCQTLSVTENTLFQAATALVLSRWSQEDQVVLGMTSALRDSQQHDETRVVGPLLNTVPLTWQFNWQQSGRQLLSELQTDLAQRLSHNRLPLAKIIGLAGWSGAQSPFEVIAIYQYQSQMNRQAASSLPFEAEMLDEQESVGHPLAVYAWPGEQLKLQARFDASRWSDGLMERFLVSVAHVMVNLAQQPDIQLGELSVSPAKMADPISTEREYAFNPILTMLKNLAQNQPEAIAMSEAGQGRALSYAKLWQQVASHSIHLKNHGVQPGDVVACHCRNSIEVFVYLLAIMESGACYLALDHNYPQQRIEAILQDSQCRFVICQEPLPSGAADYCRETAVMTLSESELAEPMPLAMYQPTQLDQASPAYMIYTSGSTGVPKASINHHGGLANLTCYLRDEFAHQPLRMLQFSSLSFDALIFETAFLMATGGELVFADVHDIRNPDKITAVLRDNSIGMTLVPPAILAHVDPQQVPDLKVMITAGDKCPPALAQTWAQRGRFYNMYGPSEASFMVLVNPVHDSARPESIGQPVPNTRFMLMDQCGQPLPRGVSGELWVSGIALAHGYHNRQELTASQFVDYLQTRYYKTADKCQIDEQGFVQIFGRYDKQIKIRGVRVELAEIEHQLCQFAHVKEAVVLPRYSDNQVTSLHAFCLLEEGRYVTAEQLRHALVKVLPLAVIPSSFTGLYAWPLNQNNKIDRRALMAMVKEEPQVIGTMAPAEQKLADLLTKVLDTKVTHLNCSFFELGGNSLNAAQCLQAIKLEYDVEVSLTVFYQLSSLQALAQWLELAARGESVEAEALLASTDLALQVCLPERIKPCGYSDCSQQQQTWLLTGVTGFVGAHICAKVLEQTDHQVICLVRAEDEAAAFERVKQQLSKLRLWRDDYQQRLEVAVGDMGLPKLGFSVELWQALATRVDHIIHCGAKVNFSYPYGLLKAANVDATVDLLSLACDGKDKSFDFISTMSLISAADDWHAINEESSLSRWEMLVGGYNQSKWVAEQICHLALERGMDINIYRLASIAGDLEFGINNQQDIIWRACQANEAIGAYPISNAQADLTPADEVGKVIVSFKSHQVRNRICHLNNPAPTRWTELYKHANFSGKSIQSMPPLEWRAALVDSICRYPELINVLPYAATDEASAYAKPLQASCQQTQTTMVELGLTFTPVTPSLFNHYLAHLDLLEG